MEAEYRGKGRLCFYARNKWVIQIECWPPIWLKPRYARRRGFFRFGWLLFQVIWMNRAEAQRLVDEDARGGNK